MLRQGDTGDWIGTFEGHKGAVWAACLDARGQRAATGAADFSAKLWNAQSGAELATFPHRHIVKTVTFDDAGERLLTGANEKNLRVWSLEVAGASTGDDEAAVAAQQPLLVLSGHTGSLKQAAWLDKDTVVSVADDKTLRIWDVRVGGSAVHTVTLPAAAADIELLPLGAASNAALPDGAAGSHGRLALLCIGASVQLWDLGAALAPLRSFPMECAVFSASCHPQGGSFVAGGDDFVMYRYGMANGDKLESHKGHFGPVHSVRYAPDGRVYASGSEDGTLRLWQHSIGETYGLWRAVAAVAPPVVAEPGPVVAGSELVGEVVSAEA